MKQKIKVLIVCLAVFLPILACGNQPLPTRTPFVQEITVVAREIEAPEEVIVMQVETTRPREVTRVVTNNTQSGQNTEVEVTRVVTDNTQSGQDTEVLDGEEALVTYIVDGDTIDVSIDGNTYRIRYIGMDTPERGAPYFDEATEANRELVEDQAVILVKDVSETDRYGRLLRYVYLQDGTFINAELVRQGYAVIATFPPDVRHQDLFLTLQQEARDADRGLWADS